MAQKVQKSAQTSGEKREHKPKTSKILVGKPWPEGIEVRDAPSCRNLRDPVVAGMAILFGSVFMAYVAYAMVVPNVALLDRGFTLVQCGLGAVAGWAIGQKPRCFVGKICHAEDETR